MVGALIGHVHKGAFLKTIVIVGAFLFAVALAHFLYIPFRSSLEIVPRTVFVLVFLSIWATVVLFIKDVYRVFGHIDYLIALALFVAALALFFVIGYAPGRHGFLISEYVHGFSDMLYYGVNQRYPGVFEYFGKVWRYVGFNAVLAPFIAFGYSIKSIAIASYVFLGLVAVFGYFYLRSEGIPRVYAALGAILTLVSPVLLHVVPLADFHIFAVFYILVFFYALRNSDPALAALAYISAAFLKVELSYVLLVPIVVALLLGRLRGHALLLISALLCGFLFGGMLDATVLRDVDPHTRSFNIYDNLVNNILGAKYSLFYSPYFDKLSLLGALSGDPVFLSGLLIIVFSYLLFNAMGFTVTYKYIPILFGFLLFGALNVYILLLRRWWRHRSIFLLVLLVLLAYRIICVPSYALSHTFNSNVPVFLEQRGIQTPYLGPFKCRYSELVEFQKLYGELNACPFVFFEDSSVRFFGVVPEQRQIVISSPSELLKLQSGCYYVYVDYPILSVTEPGGRMAAGAPEVLEDLGAKEVAAIGTSCGDARVFLLCVRE